MSAAPELVFGYQMVAGYFFFCVCQRSRGGNSQTTPGLPARLHSHSGDSLVTEEETPGTHTHTRDRETPLHTCTRGRVSARSPLPPPQFHSLHLKLDVGSVPLSDTELCHSFLVILRIVSWKSKSELVRVRSVRLSERPLERARTHTRRSRYSARDARRRSNRRFNAEPHGL